jgi:gliding motility-associatede transport system auxiliary component
MSDPDRSHRNEDVFGANSLRVVTGFVALSGFLLIAVAALLAITQGSGWKFHLPLWLAGLGVLAVIFFVFMNYDWLGKVITGRAASSGLLVSLTCAAAVVFWIGINYFFNFRTFMFSGKKAIPTAFSRDLTREKRFSLRMPSKQQLAELKKPLRIIVKGRPAPGDLDDLLKCYNDASEKVSVEYLVEGTPDYYERLDKLALDLGKSVEDLRRPEANFSLTILYGIDRFRYLLYRDMFEEKPMARGGSMSNRWMFKGEEVITSSIYELIDSIQVKVYFITDHREKGPGGEGSERLSADARALSMAAADLKRSNIEFEVAGLRTWKKVPDDATIVALIGPKESITSSEIEVLKEFLEERRGRLLICLDDYKPEVDLGLAPLLQHVGIRAGRNRVEEGDHSFRWARYGRMSIGKQLGYGPASIVEQLEEAGIRPSFFGSRSLHQLEGYPGKYRAEILCSGSEDSWGETDVSGLAGEPRFEKGVDSPGPVHYAILSWAGQSSPLGGSSSGTLGRVAVFGDSDWCANQVMSPVQGNRTVFISVINWLVGREKRIAIQSRRTDGGRFEMPLAHRGALIFTVWTVCVLLVVASILVFLVRRR